MSDEATTLSSVYRYRCLGSCGRVTWGRPLAADHCEGPIEATPFVIEDDEERARLVSAHIGAKVGQLIAAGEGGGVRARALLYDPERNPDGRLLENLLEQLLAELGAKDRAARLRCVQTGARSYHGARHAALVRTALEEALAWQIMRGRETGAVTVEIHDPRDDS